MCKAERTHTAATGFTLVELLVSLALMSVVLSGGVAFFANQNRWYQEQDVISSMDQNLRLGTAAIADTLRSTGFGLPPASNPSVWIKWVSGFTSNPLITGTSPQTISMASCFQDVATLTSRSNVGATTINVASSVSGSLLTDLFNTSNKRLILIDGKENGMVTKVTATQLTIDTDPAVSNGQGFVNSYPVGTPICRVDVKTFSIVTDKNTGLPELGVNLNQGANWQSMYTGISNLTVTTVTPNQLYLVTLTAQSEEPDPVTKQYLTRSMSTHITVKNRLGVWREFIRG